MIELKNLSKKYLVGKDNFYALKNINLRITEGEMVAICGKSGAGKSTLLHVLGCLEKFDEGDYYIEGESTRAMKNSTLARLRNMFFGFVMQDFSLINHRTSLYNVEAPMLFNSTPFFSMKKKAMLALETVGVADQARKEVINMSGGQRQRVAIARAIVTDPKTILADEPTGNLDETTTKEIMQVLLDLNRRGKTIIIVTHDDTVASYCNRKIIISDGKIISDTVD